jgi:hypothetical protein
LSESFGWTRIGWWLLSGLRDVVLFTDFFEHSNHSVAESAKEDVVIDFGGEVVFFD